MVLNDLKKLGYNVVEKLVKERTLLEDTVMRRVLLIEGRSALLRLTELGTDRYRLVVIAYSEAEDVRSMLENEGLEVSSLAEGTLMGSASFKSFSEALHRMRSIAIKLASLRH